MVLVPIVDYDFFFVTYAEMDFNKYAYHIFLLIKLVSLFNSCRN